MAFWATIAVYGALFVLSKILARGSHDRLGERRGRRDAAIGVAEGTPIPIIYGHVRVESPNLVWSGYPRFVDGAWQTNAMFILGTPGQGYDHTGISGASSGLLLKGIVINGVVQDPIYVVIYDTDGQIESLTVDTRPSYGPFTFRDGDDSTFVTEPGVCYRLTTYNQTQYADRSDIGSRLVATAFMEHGHENAGDNSRIGASLFTYDLPINDHTLWPAYRSQTKVLLTGPLSTGLTQADLKLSDIGRGWRYSFDSPDMPTVAFDVINLVSVSFAGEPIITGTTGGDANPVAVIFDILTNKWSRVGLDVAKIDAPSFAAAGVTLKSERNGFSAVITDKEDAKDLIKEILGQIDGVLYEDPETRKLVLKLVRADYDIGTLPTFTPANSMRVEAFNTSTFDQTYNEVRVIYRDRAASWADRTAVAQDMANLMSQGGRVRALTIQHRGVANAALASTIAARELNELSLPLASLSLRVNRDAWTLRPASCFKFTWPDYQMVDVVFRVQALDFGTLEDGTILVHAIQDHFAVLSGMTGELETMPLAAVAPRAIERRIFTEAPRWFLRKAIARGVNNDLDMPRGLYLGARPEERSTGYLSRLSDVGDEPEFQKTDRWQVNYPRVHGVVSAPYSRTAEPYDTSTGLQITLDSFSYLPNLVANSDEISKGKRNIAYVGGEIIGFETLTFISGFTWRLDDVWRGLLDTVPVAHAVGEPVFILSYGNEFTGDFHTGNTHDFRDNPELKAAMLPLTDNVWMSAEDDAVEWDYLTTRGRTLLPYPAANITIEGTKGTARREEEGFSLSWKRRNMNYTTITRGDDASQIVDSTQYHLYAKKIGPNGLLGDEKLIGIATSADESLEVASSEAGYGILAVFPRTVDLTTNFTNWQDPELPVEFPCWRNLLANCRFADDFVSNVTQPWTVVAGDVIRRTDLYPLGGTGTFVATDGDSNDADMHQTVYLSGWPDLVNLGAYVSFYARSPGTGDGDFDDTVTVDVIARDISGAQVGIATSGPFAPTNWWQFHSATLASLPSSTHSVRVRVRMTAVADEPPNNPDTAVAEFTLRVGQLSLPTISNPSFDVDLASWTTAVGTFTRQTTVPYIGGTGGTGGYARGGTGTTNEIYQDIALPTGFEYGTAVLEYAQGDEGGADNDLGYAQLDARSSGGSVLASANSPAIKAVTTPSSWAKRRVVLEDIPVGTANIRVRLIATRTAAGTADACFDDVRLVLFKELDPDYRLDLSVTTPPSTRFPRTGSAWYDAYPAVPPPDVMLYDGERLEGQVGIEANLGTPAMPYLGKLIGPYDGDHDTWSTSCYDFRPGCQALEAVDDGAGHFANFAAGEGLTIVAVVRPGHGNTTTRRICGRIDGTTGGWCLEYLSTGRFQARIRSGPSLQWVASPTLVAVPGGLYCVQMVYDPALGQLRCAVNDGVEVTTAVTVGTSIRAATDLLFRIGKAEASDTLFNGQVARVYGWRTAYDNFLLDMNTYGDRPTNIAQLMTCSQTGQIMVPLGDNDDGVTYAIYNPGLIPLGRTQGAWGYVTSSQVDNTCPSRDLTDAAAYPATSGSATITRTGIVGPTGEGNGIRVVTSTTNEGVRVANVPVTSATTVHAYFFARTLSLTPGDGTITLRLENTSGVSKGTTNIVIGPQWEIYDHVFTTWDDSTANMQIEICKSAAGTGEFDIAGPIVINQDSAVHHVLPYDASISQHQIEVDLAGITQQFNNEGEIYVEGTALTTTGPSVTGLVMNCHNGTNDNDRRQYTISNTSGSFAHYNATGTSATGTSGAPTWPGDNHWNARARWQRAGLTESLTSWARSITNGTASSARAATFTASTTPLVELNMSGGVDGIVRRIILFARELILGQDV